MSALDPFAEADWAKGGGLLPAIVQHADSGEVLMLGYMDREALAATRASGRVTFYSRSRRRLWMKGERSGHVLNVHSLHLDCDRDSVLVRALPGGPTCHTGAPTCFAGAGPLPLAFLAELDALVERRASDRPRGHYTTRLFDDGVRAIAQKVGEEAVETALAAVAQDERALLDESADLLFHLLVLLRARGLALADVVAVLASRQAGASPAPVPDRDA